MIARKWQENLMRKALIPFPEDQTFPATGSVKGRWGGEREYESGIYQAEVQDNFLIVTVYNADGSLYFRLFQEKEYFFNQYPDSDNPSEKMISTLDTENRRYYLEATGAEEVISGWLRENGVSSFFNSRHFRSCSNGAWKMLGDYQCHLRKQAVKKRHTKIRESISEDMLGIREELPKKVRDWFPVGPLKEYRYLVYTYKSGRKKMDGHCTYCGKEVQVENPRHQGKGRCPSCRCEVTFIAQGKYKTIYDETKVAYLEPIKKRYCIRIYSLYQRIRKNALGVPQKEISCVEEHRQFMDNSNRRDNSFSWGNFKNTGRNEWCRDSDYYSWRTWIYPGNLLVFLERFPEIQYMPIREIARAIERTNAESFIRTMQENLWVEYVAKLKLGGIIRNYFDAPRRTWEEEIDTCGRNLKEILGVEARDIPKLQEIKATIDQLVLYRKTKTLLGIVDHDSLKAITWCEENLHNADDICRIFTRMGEKKFSLKRVTGYLEKQEVLEQARIKSGAGVWYNSWANPTDKRQRGEILVRALGDWRDYLDECIGLGYDMNDKSMFFPKDLHQAHMKTTALVKIQTNPEQEEAIRKRVHTLNRKYKYKGDTLLIRPVLGIEELITEGKTLNHCVAQYGERNAEGKITILLIRRTTEPETPFYTVEIKQDKVIQCRGLRNVSATEEVEAFLKKWKKEKLVVKKPAASKQTKKKTATKKQMRIAG